MTWGHYAGRVEEPQISRSARCRHSKELQSIVRLNRPERKWKRNKGKKPFKAKDVHGQKGNKVPRSFDGMTIVPRMSRSSRTASQEKSNEYYDIRSNRGRTQGNYAWGALSMPGKTLFGPSQGGASTERGKNM